jgi:hypothetical protein
MWWIKLNDLGAYTDLMHSTGHDTYIIQYKGNYVEVEFTPDALQIWAQCGYWFGGYPSFPSRIMHKFLDLFN